MPRKDKGEWSVVSNVVVGDGSSTCIVELISQVYGRKAAETPGANTAAGGEPHPPSYLQLLSQGVQETKRSVASHAYAHKGTLSCLEFLVVLWFYGSRDGSHRDNFTVVGFFPG